MLKILTIVGARPQIIKSAALSRAIRTNFSDQIDETIVHTGQHYDHNLSQLFFKEMGIPEPAYNLEVGSDTHVKQIAAMMIGLEKVMNKEKPNAVVLYGDTNSTIAGALTASKLNYPVVHIEAGLRSFNRQMPEEINRIVCDHVSTLLFTPTTLGFENLRNEGFDVGAQPPYHLDNPAVFHCGDLMLDNSLHFSDGSVKNSNVLEKLGLIENQFILATIHRDNNIDDPRRLNSLFRSLNDISKSKNITVVMPLHPRTRNMIEEKLNKELNEEIERNAGMKIIPPASFTDIVALEKGAKMIMTDSGGIQKEAFFFKKPCIVLRSESEWMELIENGNNIIADADEEKIALAYETLSNKTDFTFPAFYGDGKASIFICQKMIEHI